MNYIYYSSRYPSEKIPNEDIPYNFIFLIRLIASNVGFASPSNYLLSFIHYATVYGAFGALWVFDSPEIV